MTSQSRRDPLLLTGTAACLVLQFLMVIGAVALVAGLVGVAFFSPEIAARAGMEAFPAHFPRATLAAVMAIGIFIVAGLFLFFGRLRAIIGTVNEGDPFRPSNAVRLAQMAWLMLGIQGFILLAVPFGRDLARYGDAARDVRLSDNGNFDVSGLLLVVVLFILARVFKQGAAIRDDLERTV